MLDHLKLVSKLQEISSSLFIDLRPALSISRQLWFELCNDPTFIYRVKELSNRLSIPEWIGKIDDVESIEKYTDACVIVATDGSQIYPDKHQGTSCALINIGAITLTYGKSTSSAKCLSEPYVVHEQYKSKAIEFSADWIDCKRQELELLAGLDHLTKMKEVSGNIPSLFMVDGSLIFWHLEGKDIELKHLFLDSYLITLKKLYEEQIFVAGYISLSKGKDLVNLILAYAEIKKGENKNLNDDDNFLDYLSDTHIASFFLKFGERTTIFKSNSPITKLYPDYLKPHFFYINVGHEIARIEIPGWIAQNLSSVNLISQMILNQCVKGDGYPICLAEAHEQAVIKGADRDFFYMLISRIGFGQQHLFVPSRKSLKKRAIGI